MKTVRLRAGSVNGVVDNMGGHGSSRTSDLLFGTVCNFARKNLRFHKATTGDLPLAYTERSLQSILLSSISDTGAVVFSERPVRRKYRGQSESYGWVDLWAYSRQVTYMIETKHHGVSWKSGTLNGTASAMWRDAVKKLKAITWESLKECTYGSAGICKVALLTLRVWQSSTNLERLQVADAHDLCDLGRDLALSLSPKATWSVVWTLSRHLQKPVIWFDEKYISYPGVLFLAWVDGPHQHS